jgi:multiple sugar transport system permease protein
MSLYYSFTDYSLLQRPAPVGWSNYRELWNDPLFWTVIRNTAYYASLALPLGLIIALALALLLNVKISGQAVYRTLIFLPSLVPAVASAMLWLWLFNGKLGLINFVLRGIGIDEPPSWLGEKAWAMPALVLMSFWGVGNTVVIFLAGLQDVPRELYEAADLDGAGKVSALFNVTLPSISPVIFFNLIMGIIGTLQYFTMAFIMLPGGAPDHATYFYAMYLYDNAFPYVRMGYASAMAWIQLLIILALTGIAFWSSRRWVHYSN